MPAAVLAACLGVAGLPVEAAESCPAGTSNMLEAAKRRESDDLVGALRDYQTLIDSFPASVCAAEAMLLSARGRYVRLDDAGAGEEMARRLIATHPTTRFAAAAHLLLARILEDRAEDEATANRARDQLRNVWLLFPPEQYPGLAARAEARTRFGELSYRLLGDSEAAAAFLSTIEEEPDSVERARARSGFAAVLLAQGDWRAAAEQLQEVVSGAVPPGADSFAAERPWEGAARRRLTLIHRARLRPAAGQRSWQSSRQLTAASLGLSRVQFVAAHEDGRLLVGSSSGDLVVADRAGRVVNRTSLGGLRGVFWGPDGEPYGFSGEEVRPLSDGTKDRLSRPLAEDGKPLKDFKAVIAAPFRGWIVLAERRHHFYDRSGRHRLTRGDPAAVQGVDLALGPRGRPHLLDARSERVLRIDFGGRTEGAAARDWKKPVALTVDAMGRIYVLDQAAGIDVFGPQGDFELRLTENLPGGVSLKDPLDLAVDGEGRLFIADRGLKAVVVVE